MINEPINWRWTSSRRLVLASPFHLQDIKRGTWNDWGILQKKGRREENQESNRYLEIGLRTEINQHLFFPLLLGSDFLPLECCKNRYLKSGLGTEINQLPFLGTNKPLNLAVSKLNAVIVEVVLIFIWTLNCFRKSFSYLSYPKTHFSNSNHQSSLPDEISKYKRKLLQKFLLNVPIFLFFAVPTLNALLLRIHFIWKSSRVYPMCGFLFFSFLV